MIILDHVLSREDHIRVLVVEPGKTPYTAEIKHDLSSLQKAVDGYIQAVYPFDDPVALICDDDGKLKEREFNRALRDEDGMIYDIVAGTFIVTGLGKNDFSSLSDEHLKKYAEYFKIPESFVRIGNKIVVFPCEETGKDSVRKIIKDAAVHNSPSPKPPSHSDPER